MAAIDKVFDYLVPAAMVGGVRVGTRVRVPLNGRRVGGWVIGWGDSEGTAPDRRRLRPIAATSGWGPAPDLIELASWAAWRWAGRRAGFLARASPPQVVRGLPGRAGSLPAPRTASPAGPAERLAAEAFSMSGAAVRFPPAADLFPFVLQAVATADEGNALVLAPSVSMAGRLAARLRRTGHPVALMPDGWADAAAGGRTVIGVRAAAWAPAPDLGAVLVLDEHDEAYQDERAPTWSGRDVAVERARRAGVPWVLTSPCPSLEALEAAPLLEPPRGPERSGWATVEVVDRRGEPPGLGLYSPRLVALLRGGGRVVCVLNRKGRARLLACGACGGPARCERCGAALGESGEALGCLRCGLETPVVCPACGSTALKALRPGVSRAREHLEVLAQRPVGEVTGDLGAAPMPDAAVLVGTEAVLHRVDRADTVVFLDLDQELLAPRYRAPEQALALLVRASRLVGGRAGGGRVVLQTRIPDHEVIDAAVHADPSRLAVVESARRIALRFPPAAALALVSGAAAETFVAGLAEAVGLEVLGPSDGRWLVRGADHGVLCDALAAAVRPPGRLRVEVDPLRA